MSVPQSLDDALQSWVAVYEGMTDAVTFHWSLQYVEAVALADLLHEAGRDDLAQHLLLTWAELDEETADELREQVDERLTHYAQAEGDKEANQ